MCLHVHFGLSMCKTVDSAEVDVYFSLHVYAEAGIVQIGAATYLRCGERS